jgi:hypothetical protein
MINAVVSIKCKKCGGSFQPDTHTRGDWLCQNCKAKNPNLKRHYRSVADLCILGLIATVVFIFMRFNQRRFDFGIAFSIAHALLLIVTIVAIYKSKIPWADAPAKILIWAVFSLALMFNVALPLLLTGWLNIPFAVVYAAVFSYLFWLNSQANKCTCLETPSKTGSG